MHRAKTPSRAVRRQVRARYRKQRPQHANAITFARCLNARQAVEAAATRQTNQQRFCLIIRMMRREHRSRLRLAISPCYWPWAWPSPVPVTLTVRTGASTLVLPVREPSPLDTAMRPLDPPAEPELPPIELLRPGSGGSRTRA